MRFNKTSDFATLSETNKIDGDYYTGKDDSNLSYNPNLMSFFGGDTTDFVSLKIQGKDKLIASYENEKGRQEVVYQGKLKKKFFEIYYHKKQFYIPFIYSRIDISRARIGKTKKGELLIRYFYDQSGNLLFLAGGSAKEEPHRYSPASINWGLRPIKANDKWGYADSLRNITIPCQFDYASLFKKRVAMACKDSKWGLIDEKGSNITGFKYDKMGITVNGYKVSISSKLGMVNDKGEEFIPVVYDHITCLIENEIYVFLGKKTGRATKEKLFIPAIYTYLHHYRDEYYLGKRGDKEYLIDENGYEYETEEEGNFLKGKYLKPILSTRRKILFEEQQISNK